jgi:hypothetical protein
LQDRDIPVTSQMKLHLLLILLNTSEDLMVLNPHRLKQSGQIIHAEMSIRTPMALSRSRRVFRQYLLAGKGRIPISSPVGITAYVSVRVTHIVPILLVKCIIRNF